MKLERSIAAPLQFPLSRELEILPENNVYEMLSLRKASGAQKKTI